MNRLRRAAKAAAAGLAALALLAAGGCLYPRDRTPDMGVAPREAVRAVQEAVDRYFASLGTLPILNADSNVPKYEKFRIDFARLKSEGFLPAPPPAAFEGGGPYLFLIVDEEREPKVRLLDLRVWDRIEAVQRRVREFLGRDKPLPVGEEIYPGFSGSGFRPARHPRSRCRQHVFRAHPAAHGRRGRPGVRRLRHRRGGSGPDKRRHSRSGRGFARSSGGAVAVRAGEIPRLPLEGRSAVGGNAAAVTGSFFLFSSFRDPCGRASHGNLAPPVVRKE